MNRFKSSAKLPSCKRERDLIRHNEFHAVLLGVAGRDLRQGVQVIRSTDEWLNSMLNADADKQRLQLGEPVVGRLTEQLDRLAGALRLYENTVTMEPSPSPAEALFDSGPAEGAASEPRDDHKQRRSARRHRAKSGAQRDPNMQAAVFVSYGGAAAACFPQKG